MKIHHIGIVVPTINDSLAELTKILKFDTIGVPTLIGSQKVNVCFMKLGQINLELIEPAENDSPIADFASKGGGFHHLCFEVKDINSTIDELERHGARLLVKPVLGFEDRMIAFLYLNMKNTNFNLIELATEK